METLHPHPILPRPVRRDPDFQLIAPRPLRRDLESQPAVDRPAECIPEAPEGIRESNRPSASDILLRAIIVESRKPETPVTRTALRQLVTRCAREMSLDF